MTLPPSRSSYLREYAAYGCLLCGERWGTTMRIHKAPPYIPCACGGHMIRQALPKPLRQTLSGQILGER